VDTQFGPCGGMRHHPLHSHQLQLCREPGLSRDEGLRFSVLVGRWSCDQ
jgi:hypothetical protein